MSTHKTTMTTHHYRITSAAGVDLGIYPGRSPEEALDAMARDAGYRDGAHATAVTGGTFDGSVIEVDVLGRAR